MNWAFQFGGYLRALGHDVRVFLNAREPVPLYRPEWEADCAATSLPDWIELVDIQLRRLLVPGRRERRFMAQLGDCDIIQTFGEYSMWAWRTGTPYVTLSYGGDVEILPFARATLKERTVGRLVTYALKGSDALVYAIPYHRPLIERLGIKRATFNPHAVPIDTDRCAPVAEPERYRLRSRFPQKLVFFHGARQEWIFKDANDKANDRLFRAFARFVKDDQAEALLVAVERGRDVERSKALLSDLGVSEHVRWVPELNKAALITMLNSVDAFFDQFSHGYFGVATLEALSCGVPTCLRLGRFDDVVLPPVLDGGSEDEILSAMRACVSEETRAAFRRSGRDWVVTYHGWRQVMEWYVRLYRDILARRATAA